MKMGSQRWTLFFAAAMATGLAASACSGPAESSESGQGGLRQGAEASGFDCTRTVRATEGAPADLPAHLACTGLYADWTTKRVAASARAYAPAAELWADGAEKSRWIELPAGSRIDTSDPDEWTFPTGTKVWKEFRLAGRRIETRMLWKTDAGWAFAVYRWSADESSAPLLLAGESGIAGTSYDVPAVSECATCHGGRKDTVLGFETVGLGVDGAQGLTLAALVAEGLLTNPPSSPKVSVPDDATGKASPALLWLHANCGNACHNTSPRALAASTGLHMKLLARQLAGPTSGTDTVKTAIGVPSFLHPQGKTWLLIAPGDSADSLIPHMDLARPGDAQGFEPMPPLASNVPDTAGVRLVTDWIDAMAR